MKICLKICLLSLCATLLASCSETPAGRSQLALIPANMLNDMGTEAFIELKRRQPLAKDLQANALVQCVAEMIIQSARERYPDSTFPGSWEVVLFDEPTPNAFALPGGKIGVHTGLLAIAENNAAQLAAVLGHEVGHLLARHGNERMTQELGINAVLLLIGIFTDMDNQLLLQALGIGAQLGVTLPFSRAHEMEADIMGLNMMAIAGFDPQQSVTLWQNMGRYSDSQPIEFLSTHPGHDTRISNLSDAMASALTQFNNSTPARCQ